MREQQLPPKAAALSEAMRDLGYSLETAVADIIDNSISAESSEIDIIFDIENNKAIIAIIDNGRGMSEDELIEAMRHGSMNSRKPRSRDDLGKFGLGLKTASFSQCTKLTVISRKDNKISGAVWDLDLIASRDQWIISVLEDSDISIVPHLEGLIQNGTMVLWENIDRLCKGEAAIINEKVFYEKMRDVEKHLSLVFHRFLSGEIKGKKFSLKINNHGVEPFDPFFISNKAVQLLHQETIRIKNEAIVIQPYILPHHSKLSPNQSDYYKDRSDFLNNQGAYVYRNGRLMVWGEWFRLITKGESTKLARVKIDFRSDLDEYWTIDIKKSRANPPLQVRNQLRKIIGKIAYRSVQVHKGRGKKLFEKISAPIWIRTATRGRIEYSINRDHPLVRILINKYDNDEQKNISELISIIESSIPFEAIYSDYSINPQDIDNVSDINPEELMKRLEIVWNIFIKGAGVNTKKFREMVMCIRPYRDYPDLVDDYTRSIIDE